MLKCVVPSRPKNHHLGARYGGWFAFILLTRKHVVRTSRDGRDTWMNGITAGKACIGHKRIRLTEEACTGGPCAPSLHDNMILRGRRIVAGQVAFLRASLPCSSRQHA